MSPAPTLLLLVENRNRERRRRRVLLAENPLDRGDDLGMRGRHIFHLTGIVAQVVQLGLQLRLALLAGDKGLADAGPDAEADELLAAVAGELAIQERPRLLRFALQPGHEAYAVDVPRRRLGVAGQLEQRRQP